MEQLPYLDETEEQEGKVPQKPARNPKSKEKEKKGKYPLWKNVLAMILLLSLFIGGAYWATGIYTRHGEEVAVPDLSGLTLEQAYDRLDALGLIGEVRDSIYTREMAPNLICKQSIESGSKVKQGRTIYLTVNSDKAPTLILPDIADNSSLREATAKLRSLGFTLTSPEYIEGDRDWVYSVKCRGRNVCAGTRIEVDAPVTLVVGDGRTMMDELEFEDTYGTDNTDFQEIGDEIIEIL